MNSALLAKQAWQVIQNPNALWIRVLKALYFPNCDFSKATRKRNESWAWASLVHGKEVVLDSARWLVSSGNRIDIRKDKWLALGDAIEINEGSTLRWVKDLIDPVTKTKDIATIRRNFPVSTAKRILQTPIAWNYGLDVLWWPASKSGEFSVKSGYFQIRKKGQRVSSIPSSSYGIDNSIWKIIWSIKVLQKIKIFL